MISTLVNVEGFLKCSSSTGVGLDAGMLSACSAYSHLPFLGLVTYCYMTSVTWQ